MTRLSILCAFLLSFPLSAEATAVRRVRVMKKERKLFLLGDTGKILRTFSISLGDEPKGPKVCEGDERTPEGEYDLKWVNEQSSYHRSIYIDYPREKDRAEAKKAGCRPGGNIFLHGLPKGASWAGKAHQLRDWTDGCIAVTNPEIDEIIASLKLPTKIEILP